MPTPENDSIRLHIESLRQLIESKHEMTQGAIGAQGMLIEAKIKGLGEKLDSHLLNYQETKKSLYGAIDTLQTDVDQAKGAMKIMKWVQGVVISGVVGLFAFLKWKTGT